MGAWTIVAAVLLVWGCGEKKVQAPVSEDESEAVLIGTWETEGLDEALGPVIARMRLREEGRLTMTLVVEGGGQRSFPGTWSSEGEQLVLRGAYFGSGEESRVRWRIDERGVLILRDERGVEQEWLRLE